MEPSSSQDLPVTTHYGRLRRLCRLLLGDLQEAEDVVQDVFLKAHEAARFGQPPTNWGAWLTRVAVNACHDRGRAGGWMRFRFRSTPVALPRRQQDVFALRYVEEHSTLEVAAALGLTTGSVKRHLHRAIRQLRRALDKP